MGVTTNPVTGERTIDNGRDTGRKWPTVSVAPRILNELTAPVLETVTGPKAVSGSPNYVELSKPGAPGTNPTVIHASVTASGAWASKPNPQLGVDYSYNPVGPNGVARITALTATDHSAETWAVWYTRGDPDGTIGGQTQVQRTAPIS